jgi:hypothetical protein
MVEGLDESFDAVIFVGYHAKADSPRGLFAHTGSGVVKDVQVNGRSAGEGGLNTLMAHWFGVPVVMITGDDVAVEQQQEWTPSVRGVVVKRAINMRAVEGMSPAEARRDIQAAARDSVAAARKPARDRQAAYNVRMQLRNFTIAEVATAFSEIRMVAPDTVEFSRATMPEAYRIIRVLYRFINPDRFVTGTDPVTCRFDAVLALPGHDRASKFAPGPIFRFHTIDDLHARIGYEAIGRFSFFRFRRSPLRDERVAVAASIERPKLSGVVEPHAAISSVGSRPVICVALERGLGHLIPERQSQKLPAKLRRPGKRNLRGLVEDGSGARPLPGKSSQQRIGPDLEHKYERHEQMHQRLHQGLRRA